MFILPLTWGMKNDLALGTRVPVHYGAGEFVVRSPSFVAETIILPFVEELVLPRVEAPIAIRKTVHLPAEVRKEANWEEGNWMEQGKRKGRDF